MAAQRLLLPLHPARLLAAATGTAAVAAASIVTERLAAGFGVGDAALAEIVGGIITLNVLLFFPPGSLGRHPLRFLPVLAANILPLVATAWLARNHPLVVQALLAVCAGAAALARPFGALAAAGATTVVMNVLIALIVGSGADFPTIAAVAALAGCGFGFAADAVAMPVLGRLATAIERRLLAMSAAAFLEEAARRWNEPGGWNGTWYEADAVRFAATAEDLAFGAGGPTPPMLCLLIGSIGRSAGRLTAWRDARRAALPATIGDAFAALATAIRRGAAGEAVVQQLRAAGLALPRTGDAEDHAAANVLGLALLLSELAQNVLHPTPLAAAPPHRGFPLGRTEIRVALQAVVSVAIAILATHVLPARRPYWIPLTVIILTSASFGETLRKSYERLLGTAGGLIAGELLWLALAGRPALATTALLVAVAAIFFGRTGAYRWLLFWITLALALLLNGAGAGSLLVSGRLVDTLIGVVIVVAVTRFILPVRAAMVTAARVRALLETVATGLRELRDGPIEGWVLAKIDAMLGAIRVASDAELLEAGLRRDARARVQSRLGAAEHIAGAFNSFAALPANFHPQPETAAALAAGAEMAAAAATGAAPAPADFAAMEQSLLGRADGSGLIRLDLRLLSMVALIADMIPKLAATIGVRSGG